MCTYNGEKFIKEQIDSILNQSHKVNEIVVCDDRSSDKTIQIVEEYSRAYPDLFRIVINDTNLKSVKNFEKAILLCSGDVIFLSDQDDVWAENKVLDYINYFNDNPHIKVLTSNGYCIDDNSKVHDKYAVWDVPAFLRAKEKDVDYYKLITYIGNIATGATMAIRKEIINEITPFPIIKEFHHDEWIAIIASKMGMYHHFDEKYFYYRIHENQQVGGVFFDKTEKNKTMITELFDIYGKDISFIGYKKKLKKLSFVHDRNFKLYNQDRKKLSFIKDNIVQIEQLFLLNKKEMKKKYPIAAFLLNLSDSISKKRKIHFLPLQ